MKLNTGMKVQQVSDAVWEIPVSEKAGMLAPARIYATPGILESMDQGVFDQVTNVACLPGITRGIVLEIAGAAGIPAFERRVSLTELYAADEVFTTGTMGELTPVLEIDGRTIGAGASGPVTDRLRSLFADRTAREGAPIPA